jgi:acetyl-CoA acetyltransferase
MADLSRAAAIAGIGQTEISKNSGRSELRLAAEAIKLALDDAGLSPADIDGLITFTLDSSDEVGVGRCLGIPDLKFTVRIPQGGAASVTTLYHAMSAIRSGICDVVVIWRAMNERSQYRFGQPASPSPPAAGPVAGGTTFMEWCMPFGAQSPAAWESLVAQRYMYEFGVSSEDLGRVSVVLRKHAATNPAAWFYGKPITLADHQASRWVVAPTLRLLDCCQESDGGVALVVTSRERARDLKQMPVAIHGAVYTLLFGHEIISDYYCGKDLTRQAMGENVRERLTQAAGIAPKQTQVAMIYDNFTPQILEQLEAYGYCGRGEAKDYVADGHLELTGKSPLSPNGGHIGEGYIHGMNLITEGVRQVRGTAVNQVRNVETVFLGSGVAGAIIGRC